MRPSKAGNPQNRKPSPPLFGIPVVVGVSDAVIAIRKVCPNEGGIVMVKQRPAARVARTRARNMRHLEASTRW
jgi:hypothetical protein